MKKFVNTTGEMKKEKSLNQIKKEHKKVEKEEKKLQKQSEKQKKSVDRKLKKRQSPSSLENEKGNLASQVSENVEDERQKVLIVRRKKEKPLSLSRKIMNFVSYILVVVIAATFGYIAGKFYYANFMNQVDYGKFDKMDLRDDAKAIYLKLSASHMTLDRMNAVELFVACEYNLSQTQNYFATAVGEVQPSIGSKQTVRGTKTREGNMFYGENYSKGMLALAEKFDYDQITKIANVYRAEGNSVSTDSARFPENPTWTFDYDSYVNEYGNAPDSGLIPYVVSSKTYIPNSESVESIGGGKYRIKMSLAKDSSVKDYVKQVKHMSGLANYPTFKTITISAIVNQDLKFESLRFDETYTVVYFGVPANCVGWLEQNISY